MQADILLYLSSIWLLASQVLNRIAALFLLILPGLSAFAENPLIEYLLAYEGRWAGDFSIHSTANGHTEHFAVEQRYWWEHGKLHGMAVLERSTGMETASSLTYLEGDKLISEIVQGGEKQIYVGTLHEGSLLWLPADMQRANDHQIRERVVEEAGNAPKLITEGFDTYIFAEGLAHIVYKGELVFQGKE